MELVSKSVRGVLVVGLAEPGTLEASNVGDFREAVSNLLDDTPKSLLDLGNVTFLDSSGLGVLIAIWRRILSSDGQIKLSRVGTPVRTVFEITRMH